jgi:hypothetical protein
VTFEPAAGRGLLICHASPQDVWHGGSRFASATELNRLYGSLPGVQIVACGHDHGSFVIPLQDRIVMNISSVSQHYGTVPQATWVAFEWMEDHWVAQPQVVSYSLDAEIARIKAVGMPLDLERGAFPLQPIYELL